MPLKSSTFRALLSNYGISCNQIVETTMRFTKPDFAPSGAHNKMIENEKFRLFAFLRSLAALGIVQASLTLRSFAQAFRVKIC